jgi:hypothetical protein
LEEKFGDRSKGQYGRGPVFTNTVEGFFSIFKRGFNDGERSQKALKGITGKRLMYV